MTVRIQCGIDFTLLVLIRTYSCEKVFGIHFWNFSWISRCWAFIGSVRKEAQKRYENINLQNESIFLFETKTEKILQIVLKDACQICPSSSRKLAINNDHLTSIVVIKGFIQAEILVYKYMCLEIGRNFHYSYWSNSCLKITFEHLSPMRIHYVLLTIFH